MTLKTVDSLCQDQKSKFSWLYNSVIDYVVMADDLQPARLI